MTLLVRDEEDILRSNIDFHLAQGVDFIVATDNKSEDSTTAILKDYEQKGLLHYIYEGTDDYMQTEWVTRMAKLAHDEYQADWVINNDADEFWWPAEGDLRSTFEAVPQDVNILSAGRYNFVPVENEDDPFYDTMIYREKVSLNTKGRPLPPKVAHRGYADIVVGQGNHGVWGFDAPKTAVGLIEIAHYPVRSYAQLTNKIIKGGQAYERNKKLGKGTGDTWRALYKQYQRNGLVRWYKKQQYNQRQIEKGLKKGKLLRDNSLSEYLRSH
ncbi:MAG: glycosyltransferase family 2 protein [Gammaproteobacteria bacterium]